MCEHTVIARAGEGLMIFPSSAYANICATIGDKEVFLMDREAINTLAETNREIEPVAPVYTTKRKVNYSSSNVERKQQILQLLKSHPEGVSPKQLAVLLKCASWQARHLAGHLVEEGLITQHRYETPNAWKDRSFYRLALGASNYE